MSCEQGAPKGPLEQVQAVPGWRVVARAGGQGVARAKHTTNVVVNGEVLSARVSVKNTKC